MTATDRAVELVHAAARAASDKLADDILAFDVSEQLVITDAFVLCSAGNERQVRSIVDEVEDKLREVEAKPVRREGERDGRWVLLDYAEIVVHVQHSEEREFYALERPVARLPGDPATGRRQLRPWSLRRRAGGRRLVLVRHGRTAWNAEGRAQGHTDISLDDRGRRQSEDMATARRGDATRRCWSAATSPVPARRRPSWRRPPGSRPRRTHGCGSTTWACAPA